MKTIKICMTLFAVLSLAPLCFAQSGMESNTATKAKNSAMSMSADESTLIANEQKIMDAIKNRKPEIFKSLVDQNGTVQTPQGARRVADVMPFIFDASSTITEYKMEDAKVMMLDKNTAILTYKSSSTATRNGKTESEMSYDSTVWVKRKGKWMAMFHQSTPVTTSPAM